jgi:hypothetical protein
MASAIAAADTLCAISPDTCSLICSLKPPTGVAMTGKPSPYAKARLSPILPELSPSKSTCGILEVKALCQEAR